MGLTITPLGNAGFPSWFFYEGLEKKKGYSEHMRSFVYLLKSRTIFSFSTTPLDLPGIVYLKKFFLKLKFSDPYIDTT